MERMAGVHAWVCRTCTAHTQHSRLSWLCATMLVLMAVQSVHGQWVQRPCISGSGCCDEGGRPRRCAPPFVNAAFNLTVKATNTCGLRGPTEYCLQTGVTGATKSCDTCDARDARRAHPASYLTDLNNNDNVTWWQSETMLEGVQYPTTINLTLNLGKSFDITYVRLRFYSSRPESFAIYKRTQEDGPWIPYQFYSASCEDTYGKPTKEITREIITRRDETKALCTNEFSDISPLMGGSIAFSTLAGRPGAYDFANSPILQEWVTATDIRIALTRMNTFGDEVFGDPSVLKSYFYAISDFAVGGICKCNGHASECVESTGQGLEMRRVCRCEHYTMGPDCDQCLPFYNNKPWAPATASNPHVCEACNCNGLSNRCFFDEALYSQTGDGGHCLDCREDTAGPNCERCKDDFYRRAQGDRCRPCNCDSTGSEGTQCDQTGRCRCKPGVTGEKCDRCEANFFDFGPSGCRPCACNVAGSRDNNPVCIPNTGTCSCKDNVEGQNCDRCKPGYFNLEQDNPFGCQACFCFGHASVCASAPGYTTRTIHSAFNSGPQRWVGETETGDRLPLQFNVLAGNVGISAPGSQPVYFVAPDRYLGNQINSYNKFLEFTYRSGEERGRPSMMDVILEGDGKTISAPIFAQGNQQPRTVDQNYRLRLHEHPDYQWTPRLTSFEFIKVLSNLTKIKVRGSFSPAGVGFLDNVKLHSVRRGSGGAEQASNVEQCSCPEGYVGQFCESCAPGYHRDPPNGGALARCVPCNCNGHSDACDVNTGRCICQHHTAGDNCERCEPGYYGYALRGSEDDCKRCPCPNNGECAEMLNGEVACINCREGYTGSRCELCSDGYFGDPEGRYGPRQPCQKCVCNDNIDPNAVGNCNSTTGECLKCIYNTAGFHCENCLPGHYGDALALPKGQCQPCNCYPPGCYKRFPEEVITCDREDGQCPCLPNVIGRNCDQCREGYWNIDSDRGCESCRCDRTGALNSSCDIRTGQCYCKPGIGGEACDQCQEYYYGFSRDGCKACNCDPEGSLYLQCDEFNGQCACKNNVNGRECDRCKENKYNITAGCIDCPACYNLVQEKVTIHRHKLNELRILIDNIASNPDAINDTDFRRRMSAVNNSVNDLLNDARNVIGHGGPISAQFQQLQRAVMELMNKCGQITDDVKSSKQSSTRSKQDIRAAEQAIDDAEKALRDAERYIETEGQQALQKAKEAQERFGHQSKRMTDIAKQAREEAERQENEAMMIENTAKSALNTSMEALEVARSAIQEPMNTANDIEKLRRDVTDADRLYERTRLMAERAQQQAEDAYKDALGIFTDVDGINIPSVNIDSFNEEAEEIKEEARDIKEKADELIDQNRDLMEDVEQQKQQALDNLNDGIRQQQIADELLADADVARSMARDAVAKAEKTLNEANDTLKTLKEFDDKVQKSKDEAEEALKKVPEIEDKINEAEQKTDDARDNLADAEADAILARDIAQQAQATAEMASDDAHTIREEAGDTKVRAVNLGEESDKLADNVADATLRLEEYERQAEEDMRLAGEALEKADQAKTSALDSSRKVGGALDSVEEILLKLEGLDSIDEDKLIRLESDLKTAEDALIDANLEERYQNLLKERDQQMNWVAFYTSELVQLRLDVKNVRQINETIPRDCFRKIELEPTDPSG